MTKANQIAETLNSNEYEQVAALDIGSNSFHLIVVRIVDGQVQVLHRVKQRVRLAAGLNKDNELSEEAIQRGLTCLQAIKQSLAGYAPHKVRIVATHTLRKAVNAKDFIQRAQQVIPYPVEVIAGVEEARLIYLGVAYTQTIEQQALVIDIGGGSTEFILGTGFEPTLCRSVQMGCVSFTARYFADGQITAKRMHKATTATRQALELIETRYKHLGWQQVIGTSGTIKAIINSVNQFNDTTSETTRLQDLYALRSALVEAGNAENITFTSISSERQPVIAAGLAILIGIFESFNIQQMTYANGALREGVIYELQNSIGETSSKERTAQSLVIRYDIDAAQAKRVLDTALTLFAEVQELPKKTSKVAKDLLAWASLLHEIGIQINSKGYQRHSAYILQNAELAGFNLKEQQLLAQLTRFCRKKIRWDELLEDFHEDVAWSTALVCLRLAVALNIKRQDDFLPAFEFKHKADKYKLTFPNGWLASKPILYADLESEQSYLSAIGVKLVLS